MTSSSVSTRIMIGRWRGCASDQAFTVCRQSTKVRQVLSKSRSWMCSTLKPGCLQLRDAGLGVLADCQEPAAMRVEAAGRIGVDVELDLADALGLELLVERRMGVLPRLERRREAEQRREQRRPRLHVVAVVRAEHLDLVQRDAAVGDALAQALQARRLHARRPASIAASCVVRRPQCRDFAPQIPPRPAPRRAPPVVPKERVA